MNPTGRRVATLLTWLFAGISVPIVHAQLLEEVIVTAQKREQSIQDVGISVTAFNGEQIKQLGFTSTQEIDQHAPGLMVTDYGNGVTTVFTVRGSSQLDFADHQEAPVAVYLDGAYNSYLSRRGIFLLRFRAYRSAAWASGHAVWPQRYGRPGSAGHGEADP